jgi:hypothetical protein
MPPTGTQLNAGRWFLHEPERIAAQSERRYEQLPNAALRCPLTKGAETEAVERCGTKRAIYILPHISVLVKDKHHIL